MTKFTKSAVIKALEEIVAELGEDYVYPGAKTGTCKYVKSGKASCLVGRVIERIDPETFKEVKRVERAANESWDASQFVDPYAKVGGWTKRISIPQLDATPAAIRVLVSAQGHQDDGDEYGVAVKEAKKA